MIVEVSDGMRLDRGSTPLISTYMIKNVDISTLLSSKSAFERNLKEKSKIKEAETAKCLIHLTCLLLLFYFYYLYEYKCLMSFEY